MAEALIHSKQCQPGDSKAQTNQTSKRPSHMIAPLRWMNRQKVLSKLSNLEKHQQSGEQHRISILSRMQSSNFRSCQGWEAKGPSKTSGVNWLPSDDPTMQQWYRLVRASRRHDLWHFLETLLYCCGFILWSKASSYPGYLATNYQHT